MNKETNLIFEQIENNIEQDSIRNYNYKVIKEYLESVYTAQNSHLKNRKLITHSKFTLKYKLLKYKLFKKLFNRK